jgi:hyperosmotically inducible protein
MEGKMTIWVRMLLIGFLLCLPSYLSGVRAQDNGIQPDNTKTNQRDRSTERQTAEQQKENPSDREMTQKIRSAVMKDKGLSTYGHNVKIITQDGAVTLKGPVRTQQEKDSIESKATEIAGRGHVTNNLEVAPEK